MPSRPLGPWILGLLVIGLVGIGVVVGVWLAPRAQSWWAAASRKGFAQGAMPAGSIQPGASGLRVAVLIAVQRYQSPNLNNLEYPEREVKAIEERLQGRMDEVHVFSTALPHDHPRYPSREHIDAFWRELEGRKIECLCFYYTGHGSARDRSLYLNLPETNPRNLMSTGLHLESTLQRAKGLARRLVFLLDACRTYGKQAAPERGSAFASAKDAEAFTTDNSLESVGVVYATEEGQAALEQANNSADTRYSVFAEAFIEFLDERAGQEAALVDLTEHLADRVPAIAARRGLEQRPEVEVRGRRQNFALLRGSESAVQMDSRQAAANPGPGSTPRRIARVQLGGETVELTEIPDGEFMMGALASDSQADTDEKPAHRVRLSGFEIGVTEVTVGQFQAYCRATGKEMPKQEDWNNTAQHPVHNVTWDEAVGFCEWATSELKRQGLPGSVRLPTEAEWEYAARGGATGIDGKPLYKYPWGDQAPAGGDGLVNFDGNGDGYAYTAPVGRFKPNGYGLRDMAGNLWEWCQDRYDEGYYAKSPVENPQGPNDLEKRYRIVRGGSWLNDPYGLRASSRFRFEPDDRYNCLGFRLARTLRP